MENWPRNNARMLDKTQIDLFKSKYSFTVVDKMIIVKSDRTVVHDINKKFTIGNGVRRLTINPEVIDLWVKVFSNYDLITVQSAYNYCAQKDDKETLRLMREFLLKQK